MPQTFRGWRNRRKTPNAAKLFRRRSARVSGPHSQFSFFKGAATGCLEHFTFWPLEAQVHCERAVSGAGSQFASLSRRGDSRWMSSAYDDPAMARSTPGNGKAWCSAGRGNSTPLIPPPERVQYSWKAKFSATAAGSGSTLLDDWKESG